MDMVRQRSMIGSSLVLLMGVGALVLYWLFSEQAEHQGLKSQSESKSADPLPQADTASGQDSAVIPSRVHAGTQIRIAPIDEQGQPLRWVDVFYTSSRLSDVTSGLGELRSRGSTSTHGYMMCDVPADHSTGCLVLKKEGYASEVVPASSWQGISDTVIPLRRLSTTLALLNPVLPVDPRVSVHIATENSWESRNGLTLTLPPLRVVLERGSRFELSNLVYGKSYRVEATHGEIVLSPSISFTVPKRLIEIPLHPLLEITLSQPAPTVGQLVLKTGGIRAAVLASIEEGQSLLIFPTKHVRAGKHVIEIEGNGWKTLGSDLEIPQLEPIKRVTLRVSEVGDNQVTIRFPGLRAGERPTVYLVKDGKLAQFFEHPEFGAVLRKGGDIVIQECSQWPLNLVVLFGDRAQTESINISVPGLYDLPAPQAIKLDPAPIAAIIKEQLTEGSPVRAFLEVAVQDSTLASPSWIGCGYYFIPSDEYLESITELFGSRSAQYQLRLVGGETFPLILN